MAVEILTRLIGLNLAAAAAILVIVLLRGPVRRLFGARLAYALWLTAPLAAAASLLPARQAQGLVIEPAPLRPIAEATVQTVGALLEAAAPLQQVSNVALSLWALGALAAIGALVWRQAATLSMLGRLTPEAPGLIRAANPAIGPAIVGILRPRIVLPADFEQRFDAREQALVMAHERAHLAVWDVRINAATALIRCLSWFNPLIHLAAVLVRVDQELACDEAVVRRHPGDRRAYAEALLKTQVTPAPLPLGCYWPVRSPHRLKERILMLTRKSPGRARRLFGAAAVTALGLGAGYAAWAAEPSKEAVLGFVAETGKVLALAPNADTAAPVQDSRRVVIRRDGGEPEVYEGDAVTPELLAQLEAQHPGGTQTQEIRRFIVRHADGAEGVDGSAPTREQIDQILAEEGIVVPEGGHRVIIQGRRSADGPADGSAPRTVIRLTCVGKDGAAPTCSGEGADPATIAKLLEGLPHVTDGAGVQTFEFRSGR